MTLYRLRQLPTDWIGIRLYSPPHPKGLTSVCMGACVRVRACVTLQRAQYCIVLWEINDIPSLSPPIICLPVGKFTFSPPPSSPSFCVLEQRLFLKIWREWGSPSDSWVMRKNRHDGLPLWNIQIQPKELKPDRTKYTQLPFYENVLYLLGK